MQTGKQYDIRAVARDRAGNVSEVKQVTNTTKTNTAPTVTDVSVSAINSYSFTVKFKATDAEGDSLNYKLTWGTSITNQDKEDTEYVIGNDGYIYMIARNLTEQTDYRYRIYAIDQTEDALFGTMQDFGKTKTWCSGTGLFCSGFDNCPKCNGTTYCQHYPGGNSGSAGARNFQIRGLDGVLRTCTYTANLSCAWCGVTIWIYGTPSENNSVYVASVAVSSTYNGTITANTSYNWNIISGGPIILRYVYPRKACPGGCDAGKVLCSHSVPGVPHYYCSHRQRNGASCVANI